MRNQNLDLELIKNWQIELWFDFQFISIQIASTQITLSWTLNPLFFYELINWTFYNFFKFIFMVNDTIYLTLWYLKDEIIGVLYYWKIAKDVRYLSLF